MKCEGALTERMCSCKGQSHIQGIIVTSVCNLTVQLLTFRLRISLSFEKIKCNFRQKVDKCNFRPLIKVTVSDFGD